MAHFRPDVSSAINAESLLQDLSPGAHITWRSSDVDYVLSFMDRARVVQHVRIVRDPDGSFVLVDARPLQVFSTLSALVTSRKYLSVMATEFSAGGAESASACGGEIEVPPSIPPPKPGSLSAAAAAVRSGGSGPGAGGDDRSSAAAGGDDADAGAALPRPQTRVEQLITAIEFATHGVCGAVLVAVGCKAGSAWLAHGSDAAELQEAAVNRFTGHVDAASLALARDLHSIGTGPTASDEAYAVSQCTAAAQSWASSISAALSSGYGGPSTTAGSSFPAAAAAGIGMGGGDASSEQWSLLPAAVAQLADFAPACTQALLLAAAVLLLCVALKPPQQVHKRTGDVYPLHSGWYRPRTLRALVIAAAWLVVIASGAALVDSFWRLGGVSTHVEVAAMPFLTPPPRKEVQMHRPGPSANESAPAGAAAVVVQAAVVSPAPSYAAAALARGTLPFAYRDRGAAYAALGVPAACAEPLQAAIGAVARDGITLLRAPLAAVLPPWLLSGRRAFADACAGSKQSSGALQTVLNSFALRPPEAASVSWLVDCSPPLPGTVDAAEDASISVASAASGSVTAASILIPSHRGAAGVIVVGSSLLIASVGAVVLLRSLTRDALRWLSSERRAGHTLDDAVAAALAAQERVEREGADPSKVKAE